jgi:hypothetical protein
MAATPKIALAPHCGSAELALRQAELPMLIGWCRGVTLLICMLSRVTKRPIKIRNQKRMSRTKRA